jgi:hypothetical protein
VTCGIFNSRGTNEAIVIVCVYKSDSCEGVDTLLCFKKMFLGFSKEAPTYFVNSFDAHFKELVNSGELRL